jgi:hypothetical protein
MTRDLLAFLTKWLAPHYKDAHDFLAALAAEAKDRFPNGRLVILTQFDTAGEKHTIKFFQPPEDVFRELGINADP